MNMAKRFFSAFLAFALCAAMSLGSLSFMPKASAVSDFEFPFSVDDIPAIYKDYSYYFGLVYYSSSNYWLEVYYSNSSFRVEVPSYNQKRLDISSGVAGRVRWDSSSQSFTNQAISGGNTIFTGGIGTPFPFINQGVNFVAPSSAAFAYSFVTPKQTIPKYWDYVPFYFPEMPHGYFDGNINVVDGTYNIDFPSNASVSGQITQTGNDHYQYTLPDLDFGGGQDIDPSSTGAGNFSGSIYTPVGGYGYGDITQTAYANRLISLSLSNLDSTVTYTPAYNEDARFRCWSCVMDSSYVWFVSDTRNKITGSIVSVTSDEVTWKYEFADPQGGNTIYPTWAIVFSPMGEVIQVLSPTNVSNKNTYTLSCSIGTLEQDQDNGIWSCDPLYHGLWFSNDSPPVANITHLQVAENRKYLANPVFGESAFQLEFLDSINRGIADINTNIQSLQSAMQSSISGQTSAFQNMDAPSAEQPDTTDMMTYFESASVFDAPDTSSMFSGDIKTGHAWQGVTWWSSKFNDIIVANQTIVGFTTAMLTLGLAVLILGRRFRMR